jgi:hypothetical protein
MTVRRTTPNRNLPEGHEPETSPIAAGEKPPLLTQRAALILFVTVLIAVAVGILAFLAGGRPAEAVLAGGAACAAAITLLNALIG